LNQCVVGQFSGFGTAGKGYGIYVYVSPEILKNQRIDIDP